MKVTVVADLDGVATMLRRRGLEPGGRVQWLFTSEVAKHADPYVPMDQGILKNTRIIDAASITYNTPYARNMYYGKVMVDPVTKAAGFMTAEGWRSRKGVKKVVSTRDYQYHGSPMRGPFWIKRMWADKKNTILNNVAAAAGGRPK